MSDKSTLLCTILFVTFAALANLFRFLWDVSISIGSWTLPGWTGALLYLALALLATWSFKALANLYSPLPINPVNPLPTEEPLPTDALKQEPSQNPPVED